MILLPPLLLLLLLRARGLAGAKTVRALVLEGKSGACQHAIAATK